MSLVSITLRNKAIKVPAGTKAEIARVLFSLPEGYTVSEVSKAIPMAYSQAHSLKKHQDAVIGGAKAAIAKVRPAPTIRKITLEDIARSIPTASQKQAAKNANKKVAAVLRDRPIPQTKLRPGIGKLRTPGLPSDRPVGECVNCAYELVVRSNKGSFMLVHTGMSAEEYLAEVQFCTPVPKVLL